MGWSMCSCLKSEFWTLYSHLFSVDSSHCCCCILWDSIRGIFLSPAQQVFMFSLAAPQPSRILLCFCCLQPCSVWYEVIELTCLPFSVDDALCQGHLIIQKLKMDPGHQAWQNQHRDLGSHAFPHLGSCSTGCNFRKISLSLC